MRGQRSLVAVAAVVAAAVLLAPAGTAAATRPTPHTDRASPPPPLVTSDFVSAAVRMQRGEVPVLVSSGALPLGYYVDRRLAERFGTNAVVAAMSQWDGVAGSRWGTKYLGIAEAPAAKAAADGRSVVFVQESCAADHGGHAYRQMETAVRHDAYGDAAFYLTEVDIGVCPSVLGLRGLQAVLAHEVGHALGLDHLCDAGEECWREGMGQGSHACRVMYHGLAGCLPSVTARDHAALRHLYPTLRRLSGRDREKTAARASYATTADRGATRVVIARSDESAHGPLAAAALASSLDAPLLLARPDRRSCLAGAAVEELGRVGRALSTIVLVGDWPSSCENALLLRGQSLERIKGSGPVRLSVAVANYLSRGRRMGEAAVLVSSAADSAGNVPDGVAAGAAAGAAGGPVLYTARAALPDAVAEWLRSNPQIRRVYVVGGTTIIDETVLDDLRAADVEPVRVAGADRVTTALALADRPDLFAADAEVVVASWHSWADAVTASAVGGRISAPVLLTGSAVDPRVHRWLGLRRPASGYVVGGPGAVAFEVQRTYTAAVDPNR